MKAYNYGDAGSRSVSESDIPDNVKSKAEDLRIQLVETVAENSEELMNKYFEEGSLSDEDLKKGLKIAIKNGSLVPVFAMSATKAIGVNNFLDFASDYEDFLGGHVPDCTHVLVERSGVFFALRGESQAVHLGACLGS